MGEFLSNLFSNLLLIFVLFCVLPSILVLIAGYFALRNVDQFFSPDITTLYEQYDKLRTANPKAHPETLVRKIIRRQAMKAGIVGAITGMGGFLTLPVALPVDIIMSMRIQAGIVGFIAAAYGVNEVSQTESRLRSYLVMTGGMRATQSTFNMVMRMVLRFIPKFFTKLIPFIGAIIGYTLNYAMARATADVALRWYADKARKLQAAGQSPHSAQ
jgi:hypothetical protein